MPQTKASPLDGVLLFQNVYLLKQPLTLFFWDEEFDWTDRRYKRLDAEAYNIGQIKGSEASVMAVVQWTTRNLTCHAPKVLESRHDFSLERAQMGQFLGNHIAQAME